MLLKDDQSPPHKPGVYAITNLQTGRSYIGSSCTSIKRRFWRHRGDLRAGTHACAPLQEDFVRLGEDTFLFETLQVTKPEEALSREQYWSMERPGERYNVRAVTRARRAYTCPSCGTTLGGPAEGGQALLRGYCKACKPLRPPRPTSYICPNCSSSGLSWQAFTYAKGSGRCTRYCTGETTPSTTPDAADVFAALLKDAVQALAAAGCTEEAVDTLRRTKRATVMSLLRMALAEQPRNQ